MTVPSPLSEAYNEPDDRRQAKRARTAADTEASVFMPAGHAATCARTAMLGSADGFYAHWARIPADRRRVVLLRLPRDVPTASLAGARMRLRPRSNGVVADVSALSAPQSPSEGAGVRQRIVRGGSAEIPVALVVPKAGTSAVDVVPFDDMWTLCREPADAADVAGATGDALSVRMSEAATEGGRVIPQPPHLAMRLSAVDFGSVLDRSL